MNRHMDVFLVAVLFAGWGNIALAMNPQGQETPLRDLYAQALQARGPDYVSIRLNIINRGPTALPFLRKRLADEDWHSRIVAEAMIGRITDPEKYRHYEELMVKPIILAGMHILPAYRELPAIARGLRRGYPAPGMEEPPTLKKGLHEAEAIPFLLEIVLRDSVTHRPDIGRQLPEEDPEKLYTIEEVAEKLNITLMTARYWDESRSLPVARRDPEGKPYIKHKCLQQFARKWLPRSKPKERDPYYSKMTRCYAAALLGKSGHPMAVPALIEVLQSDDPMEVKFCAAAALGMAKNSQALEPLIRALEHEEVPIRERAAWALGQLGDPAAIGSLVAALEDARIRYTAQEALGEIEDPLIVKALVAALKDQDLAVRESAAMALRKIKDPRVVGPLIEALKDEGPAVRARAAFALGQLRDRRAVEPLIEALKDGDSGVRKSAARALGEIKDRRAVEPLTVALKDQDSYFVRERAANALGKIKDAGAIEPLIAALQDEKSGVRLSVALALREITGRHFGPDHARWRDWWEKNRADFRKGKQSQG